MSWWERHLARTINGTAQLGQRRWRWLWETRAGRTIIARLIITAGWGWALYRLGGQWPWLWAVAVVGVLVAAYRSAEDEDQDDTEQLLDAEPEPESEPLESVDARQLIIDSVLHLADGYANVLLSTLYAHMDGAAMQMDLSEFRRWVEAHDVPTRDAVKANGRVGVGVRVADLPAAAPTPPPAVPDDLFQDW